MNWLIELLMKAAEAIVDAVDKRREKKRFDDVDDEIDRRRRRPRK